MKNPPTSGHVVASNLHACQIISGRDVERVAKQINAAIADSTAPLTEIRTLIDDYEREHLTPCGLKYEGLILPRIAALSRASSPNTKVSRARPSEDAAPSVPHTTENP